jgi:tetratricopeptide (TPR) repeat protein
MSPEQAAGRLDELGPATDVYGLGGTLYYLLTGRAPVEGRDTAEVLRRVQAGEYPPPRRVTPSAPPALEAICLKAMSLRPGDRYSSVHALAEDIEHWLADEPVSAWCEPWAKRARRWALRHRTALSSTAAACLVALVAGAASVYTYERQVQQEATALRAALARAEQARDVTQAAWAQQLDASGWGRAEDAAAAATALAKPRLPVSLLRRARALVGQVAARGKASRSDRALLTDLTAIRAASNDPGYDTNNEYRRAFERGGIYGVTDGRSEQAANPAERPRAAAIQLASFLDHWAVLQGRCARCDSQARLAAMAHDLDPDPWRDELREALILSDRAERRQALLKLAEAPDMASQPPVTLVLLAEALSAAGSPDVAVRLLEPAQFVHDDPWIHHELGLALRAVRPPRREDALRALTAATALRPLLGFELVRGLSDTGRTAQAIEVLKAVLRLRPDAYYECYLGHLQRTLGRRAEADASARRALALCRTRLALSRNDPATYANLGAALHDLGDMAGAVAAHREAVRLLPDSGEYHYNLGTTLVETGDLKGAIAAHREAIRLKPDFAAAHNSLGAVLRVSGDLKGAIAACREAIRLQPDIALAHANLGADLDTSGDVAGAVAAFREAIRLKPDLDVAHHGLGHALHESGDLAGAIAAFRDAIRIDPDFAATHSDFGNVLSDSGDLRGAIAEHREAIRLKPDLPQAHINLAAALGKLGDLAGAIAECREAIRLSPEDAEAHCILSTHLLSSGDVKGAIAASREAIRLKPVFAGAHYNLGVALQTSRDLRGATTAYREAIRLKPDYAEAHTNLGIILNVSGASVAAIASYREAIRLKPDLVEAHANLGVALVSTGDLTGAIAAFREAIRLRPDDAEPYNALGGALVRSRDPSGAIAAFREAIRLNPDLAEAHYNLGNALGRSGDRTGAVAAFREAIRSRSDLAEAHCNLAQMLYSLGQFRESLEEYLRGHELGSRRSDWSYPSAEWVENARRLATLEAKLETVLAGRAHPADPWEAAELSGVAHAKQLYASASRLAEDAFAAEPALANDLTNGRRYSAACAAALAGCGRGKDAPPPSPEDRAALRRRALDWLRADLDAQAGILTGRPPARRQSIAAPLRHWTVDADLAGLRDTAALAALPENERTACRRLWADVEDLLRRSSAEAPRVEPRASELPLDPFAK